MSTSGTVRTPDSGGDAPLTLAESPPRTLGVRDALGLWGNLGISLLLPWVAGFVAYQLTLPTFFTGPGSEWTAWWSARQADLGIDPANGWSASLLSLAVAGVLTVLVALPGARRDRQKGGAA
jgi:hypothetical protein